MLVIDDEIVTCFSELHPSNALLPTAATSGGISTLVKEMHL